MGPLTSIYCSIKPIFFTNKISNENGKPYCCIRMWMHPISEANEKSPFGSLTPDEFYSRHGVAHSASYFTNSRGLKLFTQSWTPLPPTSPVGVVAILHGITSESSGLIQLTAVYFARSGFITCAVDHQGHGYSEALDGHAAHIPDINPVVDDCIAYFDSFRSKHPSLPSFLYGESLGGAIAILMHLRRTVPRWDGMILSGAMCGLRGDLMPPWIVTKCLTLLASLAPTWRVVPTDGELCDLSIKEEWKRRLVKNSPAYSKGRPRLGTAMEIVRVCAEVRERFEEVDVGALLIVHGGDDKGCDPVFVQELYERAATKDKTIKIYDGMGHLLVGEAQEDVDLVFGDILQWLRDRVGCSVITNEMK